MNLKFYLFAFLLCIGQEVFGYKGIEDIKKMALQRIQFNVESIRKIINETTGNLPRREAYLGTITKHEREFGDGILEKGQFEIRRSAISNYIMINLLESSNEVYKCIQYREKEGIDYTKKYFNDNFLKVGSDYEQKAIALQNNILKSWRNDYNKAIKEYSNLYDSAVSQIYKSKDEAQILSIVKDFENYSIQMSKIVTSVNVNVNKNQIAILEILDRLVFDMKKFMSNRVEETIKLMVDCYKPKTNYLEKA